MRLIAAWSVFLFLSASLYADVTTFTGKSSFESQGTIVYNTNFDGYGTVLNLPEPYTVGGVTYAASSNIILGPNYAWYGNPRSVLLNDYWSPFPGTISTSPVTFNMFGFSVGMLGNTSTLNITLNTNLKSYHYAGLLVPNVQSGLAFEGFIADPGEYFTGFNLYSTQGGGSAPAITDIELGSVATVPEPAAISLLGCGVASLALLRKRLLRR